MQHQTVVVNYCLIYGISETTHEEKGSAMVVKYCLIYSASETNGTPRAYL